MQTLFIGKNIIHLSEVDSTNNYANQLLRQSVINEGDIVITDNQQLGKGQRGNTWFSEPKMNLTFSLILKPKFLQVAQQFYLTKAISLSIVKVLKHYLDKNISIKWPNDIYVENKKIAGILIENTLAGSAISSSIVGIGINVNQSDFGEINATSLINERLQKFDLNEVLEELCKTIEQHYIKLKTNHLIFDTEYLTYLMGLNEMRGFEISNKKISGSIKGVNKIGQLEVEINNNVEVFNLKEIRFID